MYYLCRDLKPANILVYDCQNFNLEKGTRWTSIDINNIFLKISDYGLGRSSSVTGVLQVSQTKGLGTEGYIAPEIEQGSYDGRADIWSFAVVMHELAAKEKPKGISAS